MDRFSCYILYNSMKRNSSMQCQMCIAKEKKMWKSLGVWKVWCRHAHATGLWIFSYLEMPFKLQRSKCQFLRAVNKCILMYLLENTLARLLRPQKKGSVLHTWSFFSEKDVVWRARVSVCRVAVKELKIPTTSWNIRGFRPNQFRIVRSVVLVQSCSALTKAIKM